MGQRGQGVRHADHRCAFPGDQQFVHTAQLGQQIALGGQMRLRQPAAGQGAAMTRQAGQAAKMGRQRGQGPPLWPDPVQRHAVDHTKHLVHDQRIGQGVLRLGARIDQVGDGAQRGAGHVVGHIEALVVADVAAARQTLGQVQQGVLLMCLDRDAGGVIQA